MITNLDDKTEPAANRLSSPRAAVRGRKPARELFYRARDPKWVADTLLRVLAQGWDAISPSEFSRLYRQVRRHTMCSNARLRGLYRAARYVVQHRIPGDFVECGCALGGSAALIKLTLRQLGESRALWLFDTFEGLPAPTAQDSDFEFANLYTGSCVGTVDEVRHLFEELRIEDGVHFVKGLFQEELPKTQVSEIALLHIDGDWYESVKTCLENLYDRVVPGGFIQFDDYGYWKGARRAIDEFLGSRKIQTTLVRLDYSGRQLVKRVSPGK